MNFLSGLWHFITNLDTGLAAIVAQYGTTSYVILFAVIFLETGIVFAPFLPGDSLIFTVGALSAMGVFDPLGVFILLFAAAVLGDAANYWLGHHIGKKIFEKDRPFISEDYLKRTQNFYEKHGKKTIILARFVPIIRTFAPFIAGVGRMNYTRFAGYNALGAILWVGVAVWAGYFFGNVPFVKAHFELVILAIIFISLIPAVFEFWKHRRK